MGRPLLPENLGQSGRDGAKSPIFDLHCVPKNVHLFILPITLSITDFNEFGGLNSEKI